MRLAFVDLQFSWPPKGGAEINVFRSANGIRSVLGHEVKLFVRGRQGSWERGAIETSEIPFPVEVVPGSESRKPAAVAKRMREAVDAWAPDAVMVCFGFFLKPYVVEALAHYPLALRYYAYEAACPRDFRLFKEGKPCPKNYLETPDTCRRCTLHYRGREIAGARPIPYIQEYLDTRAYTPAYYRRTVEALGKARVIIASNPAMAEHFRGLGPEIVEVPGEVDLRDFRPPPDRPERSRAVVLMAGRSDDPTKGFGVLMEAARILERERYDFEIWVTQPETPPDAPDAVRAVGWHDPAGLYRLYEGADVAVVPSVWEEPFGRVAVEAMAAGLPVVATRVGGLQRIVLDGETGFLVPPADSHALADALRRLITDRGARRRMGSAGRARVEQEYAWERVIAKHYPPILDKLAGAEEAAR